MSGIGPARGVLRADPSGGAFEHLRLAPPPDLADLLAHGWCVRWDLAGAPPQPRETLPHPNVHLVFERDRTRCFGPHSARFVRVLDGAGCVVGLKFLPGGFRPLLGRAVATIADGSIALDAVFGTDTAPAEAAVLDAGDAPAMLAAAFAFLRSHRPPPDPAVARVAALVDAIAQDRSITGVDAIVARHGVDKRTLQRLFREYVGVGPKWVVARYRLHEALEQIDAGTPVDFAALALELGYYDQAHFIRDFTRLVGRSPAQYARRA